MSKLLSYSAWACLGLNVGAVVMYTIKGNLGSVAINLVGMLMAVLSLYIIREVESWRK